MLLGTILKDVDVRRNLQALPSFFFFFPVAFALLNLLMGDFAFTFAPFLAFVFRPYV